MSEFQENASSYVAKEEGKGLVVAYLKDGEKHYKTYGSLSQNDNIDLDENSLFEIGAVTQVYTTALLMQFVTEELLDPSDCVNKYLDDHEEIADFQAINCVEMNIRIPSRDPYDKRFNQKITSCFIDEDRTHCISLCDLASHTSGIRFSNRTSYNFDPAASAKNASVTKKDISKLSLLEQLRNYDIATKPGQQYYYSSANMTLLASVLESIKDKPYEEMIEQYFFAPIGMQNSFFISNSANRSSIISGYDKNNDPVQLSNYDAAIPAAGGVSSAHDLLLFLEMQLNDSKALNSIFELTHQIKIDTRRAIKKKQAIIGAYGWLVSPLLSKANSDKDIYWIHGATNGHRAFIAFEKSTNTAVVVLSNTATDVNELGLYLIEALMQEGNLLAKKD